MVFLLDFSLCFGARALQSSNPNRFTQHKNDMPYAAIAAAQHQPFEWRFFYLIGNVCTLHSTAHVYIQYILGQNAQQQTYEISYEKKERENSNSKKKMQYVRRKYYYDACTMDL